MRDSLLLDSSSTACFDTPLALLSACHQRILKQSATLQRLSAHLVTHGADTAAQQAAAQVVRYFDTAGHHHHQDEEQDLLPALLDAMAGSDAICLRDMRARITLEHRELDAVWYTLRTQLVALMQGDTAALDPRCVADFVARQQRHISFEEGELLPMAARLLSEEQLQALGQAMRDRRQVPS